jgi:hypothetical protein
VDRAATEGAGHRRHGISHLPACVDRSRYADLGGAVAAPVSLAAIALAWYLPVTSRVLVEPPATTHGVTPSTFLVTQCDVQIGLASGANLMTVPYGWSTWGLRRSLREVLVDAAPGRGDDYIMLDPARDMRHERMGAWTLLSGLSRVSPSAGRCCR